MLVSLSTIIVVILLLLNASSESLSLRLSRANGTSINVFCVDLPENVLLDILGPAYNSRYMSVRKPSLEEQLSGTENSGGPKRDVSDFIPIAVEENYEQILDEKPAWATRNHYNLFLKTSKRMKRSNNVQQWDCVSRVIWIDLGADYFPRYLRSVECVQKTCWYGHFSCKPRSFTVKLLRRRQGMCVTVNPGTTVGNTGIPKDLRALWVWEERAVTFCCDCSQ